MVQDDVYFSCLTLTVDPSPVVSAFSQWGMVCRNQDLWASWAPSYQGVILVNSEVDKTRKHACLCLHICTEHIHTYSYP